MNNWITWRGPIVGFAVAAMLLVAGIGSLIAAGDLNEASEGQATASALTKAAANIELAWYQAMGADALAATGEAPDEAQGFYDGAINLYNEAKAVLSAAGVTQIDQALAGSDEGLASMTQAFEGTLQLAATQGAEAATAHHLQNTVAIYNAVDPAVDGLATIAEAADAKLQSSLDSGASTLRWLSIFSLLIAAAGLAYAAYSAWTVYQKETAAAEQPAQLREAA